MISVVPFQPDQIEAIRTLWRRLHSDWPWLDDPEAVAKLFEPRKCFERVGYVVRRGQSVIASIFGNCELAADWPRNRSVNIEARPEDIEADWLDPLLAQFAELDRPHPGTWQVATPPEALCPVLVPRLEAAGFGHHSSSMRLEWEGDTVAVVDPSPARFERYAGGNTEIDQAIVELHNRAYRPARLVPPYDAETLWKSWPGLAAHEYVLARDGGRIVGYAEWFVVNDTPYISSFVAARSHWGTPVGAAVGTKAMQILLELGHRKLGSNVASTNAASIKLHLRHGWRVVAEQARTYVRKF